MGPGQNFFVVSCTVLVLATINMGVGPIMNKKLGKGWGLLNCAQISDIYEEYKTENPSMTEKDKEEWEYEIRHCKQKKVMYNMEYTSFIFNMVIGFICVIIGLYGIQKKVIPNSGLIAAACGVVGFTLTLVYVIYSMIVYTKHYEQNSYVYKRDSDGSFAKLDGELYKCLYFKKEGDVKALYAKYSDLIKSQYNYNKKLTDSFVNVREKNSTYGLCVTSNSVVKSCSQAGYINSTGYFYINENNEAKPCSKLYYKNLIDNFTNFDRSARILAALISSILILLCYCALLFSGLMLSKESF